MMGKLVYIKNVNNNGYSFTTCDTDERTYVKNGTTGILIEQAIGDGHVPYAWRVYLPGIGSGIFTLHVEAKLL